MRFLQSVIADARPRKHMLESPDGPATMIGLKARELEGNASGAEQKSPGTPDQASRLNTSLPVGEVSGDFKVSDAPALAQSDNPVGQDTREMGNNSGSESPLSVPVDNLEPIHNEESSTYFDTGILLDRESALAGDKAPIAENSTTPIPAGTVISDRRISSQIDKDQGLSTAFPETHRARYQTPDLQEIEPVSSPASNRDLPEKELTDNDGNSALQVEEGAEQLLVHETMSMAAMGNKPAKVNDVSGLLIEQTPMPENPAVRNAAKKAFTDSGTAHQVLPNIDEQADITGLSSQEDISRLKKQDESKGARGDIQLASGQVMVVSSQESSATEHASVPQSVGKKVSTLVSSSAPAPTKSGSREPHIARPARSSANPEALRSVPAMPLQTDFMSKAGDTLGSRPPFRPAEKTHEAPKVQIGQIDVIIEAATQPVSKPAPSSTPTDLASRHYLRRL